MQLSDAIQKRQSIKRFTDRAVSRAEIETVLAAATQAPNHRLTQPWRFYVLGPEARYAYGLALGDRKAKKLEDPAAKHALRETIGLEHRALPSMIADMSSTARAMSTSISVKPWERRRRIFTANGSRLLLTLERKSKDRSTAYARVHPCETAR